MSKSTPKAPDYTAAAEAQAQSSREVTEQQTWVNRPDQITPFGSQSWQNQQVWDPSTQQWLNRWAQVTELNPTLQTAADAQMQMTADRSQLAGSLTNRMQNEYGQAMDWSGFSPMAQTPQGQAFGLGQYSPESIQRNISNEGLTNLDPSQRYYQQAGDAIWNQWADRNLPLQQQDEARIRGQLYNSGLKEGDEAYNREMERLRQSQGDARQQAAYQATIGAGQEAQRMLGMDAGTRQQLFGERGTMGQFANAASQQALQQQLGLGGQQFQENMGYNNQMFNQQMQSAGYQNQLRQQQILSLIHI